MSTYDDLEPLRTENGPIRGVVDNDPVDESEPLYVRIPTYDEHLRFGPCRWQMRHPSQMPAHGDICLILFDNLNMPWVVVHWPFGGTF